MTPTTEAGLEVANWLYSDWDQEFNVGIKSEEDSYRSKCDEAVVAIEAEAAQQELERIGHEFACARCGGPAVVRAELQRRWKIVAGMPWPASCRHCDLVTEDPDAYFLPPDWDEDLLPESARCPSSDFQMAHEARTLDDFRLVLGAGGQIPSDTIRGTRRGQAAPEPNERSLK